jgi:TonB family protein
MLRPICVFAATLVVAFCAAEAAETPHRPESQQEYWAQIDRKDWSAAIAAAEQLVAAARPSAAQQPLVLAEALTLLGNAQLGARNFDSAVTAFNEALQITEARVGAASPKLLDPLRGLGYTLAAAERHKEAIPPLERALLIDRRSYGLYDMAQQKVLRQLADSLVKVGRPEDAQRHVAYLVQLGERVYGKRDPRQVPILCFAAGWHGDLGDFISARAIYRAAIDIVESKLGPDDLASVEPLRGLASTYTQELYFSTLGLRTQTLDRTPTSADGNSNLQRELNPRFLGSEGEKALERAVKVLDAQPPSAYDTLLETLIQTGDWFQIKHMPEKAMPYYRRAAALSSTIETAEAALHPPPGGRGRGVVVEGGPLAFPVRVYYPTPSQATRNTTLPADQVDERFVAVAFTVTDSGEVEDAKITEANGTARETADALAAIRAARFRPQFVNGEPVKTTGMTTREVFRTRKESVSSGR